MKFLSFCKLIFLLLSIIALTTILPICVAFFYKEYFVIKAFTIPASFCFAISLLLLFITKNKQVKLSAKSGFAIVSIAWTMASVFGAIPFVISKTIPSFTDAFFESVSGFTTTGATILSEIESLPRSINLWRTQMHWLGGMGIVALTVALMPLLGVGGFQLIKAETTGPDKSKITPKITMTAKILWFIYLAMTVIQTVLLMIAGMDFVDALSHTFATLGTGGFSTRNLSVGQYNSVAIDWICTIFMLLAGVNFSLYYKLFLRKGKEVLENTELKVYIFIVIIATLFISLLILPQYGNFFTSLRYSAFQVASIITTTGFTTQDYTLWAQPAQFILFLLMFIGGCSGSTAGSIKVIRWVILSKQMTNEMRRMIHPYGVYNIRLNKHAGRKDIVFSVAGFIFLFLLLVFITAFIATFDGTDIITSFSASLALIGNIGPGFGKVGPAFNYGFFSPFTKWWFSFAMIAGRLELYTILIFCLPSYWKK